MVVFNNLRVYTIPNSPSSLIVGGKYTAYVLTVLVSSVITYTGVTFSTLSSNPTVLNAFVTGLTNTLASSLGVDPSKITITVSSGSVIVNYTIKTDNYAAAQNLSTNIQTANSNPGSSPLVTALANITSEPTFSAALTTANISISFPAPSIAPPAVVVTASAFTNFSSNVTNFNQTTGTYNYALNWTNPSLPAVLPILAISTSPVGLFNLNASNLYSNTSNFASNLPAVPYGQTSNYIINLTDLNSNINNTTPYTITIQGSNYPQGIISSINPSSITYCNVTIAGTTTNYYPLSSINGTIILTPGSGSTYTSNITLTQFSSGVQFSNLQSATPYSAVFSASNVNYGNSTLTSAIFLTSNRDSIGIIYATNSNYSNVTLQWTENYPASDSCTINIIVHQY